MPGVRYGADIADDAAQIYKGLKDIQDSLSKRQKLLKRKQQDLKKAGKKTKSGRLAKASMSAPEKRRFDDLARKAKDMFGVTKADIKKGNYGDLYDMQKYSTRGITKSGKAARGSKFARNKRTGKIMKRSETDEYARRGDGKTTRSYTRGPKTAGTELGRTQTRKFTEIADRSYARMQRGGVRTTGRKGVVKKNKITNRQSLDNLRIARPDGQNARPKYRVKVQQPKKAASAKRAKTAQSKTKRAVTKAGKAKKPTTSRKK